jgi:hypothetical protein
MTMLANRLSCRDFHGPNVGRPLRPWWRFISRVKRSASECSVAVVGGVNVMLIPDYFVVMSNGRFCWDGYCKCFDEAADGYARNRRWSSHREAP